MRKSECLWFVRGCADVCVYLSQCICFGPLWQVFAIAAGAIVEANMLRTKDGSTMQPDGHAWRLCCIPGRPQNTAFCVMADVPVYKVGKKACAEAPRVGEAGFTDLYDIDCMGCHWYDEHGRVSNLSTKVQGPVEYFSNEKQRDEFAFPADLWRGELDEVFTD